MNRRGFFASIAKAALGAAAYVYSPKVLATPVVEESEVRASQVVVEDVRKLRARWTLEASQELAAFHSFEAQSEVQRATTELASIGATRVCRCNAYRAQPHSTHECPLTPAVESIREAIDRGIAEDLKKFSAVPPTRSWHRYADDGSGMQRVADLEFK